VFGAVKSAKVSLSPVVVESVTEGRKMYHIDESSPCVSNGYGFVCFENEEDAKKLIEIGSFEGVEAFMIQIDPKTIKNKFNNIYVKNFSHAWDEARLREIFGRFGTIFSVYVKNDPNNEELKFAFICFFNQANHEEGFIAAKNAVNELNDPNGGLYVQPALSGL
jgi:RNA recognition motif-containing protein